MPTNGVLTRPFVPNVESSEPSVLYRTTAKSEADDFASLAVWLLSKNSRYITGQTIAVDGGIVKGTL